MRKIIAGLFISLDGVTESPDQWHFPWFNDEMGAAIGENMAGSDTMLLGRKTYEEWASYWPDKTSADDQFADYLNNIPKLVASTTLESVDWQNSTLITGDVYDELRALKQQDGKNIVMSGSVTLVRNLLVNGVLDELDLLVHPIAVGRGARLFDDLTGQVPLRLLRSETFETGVLRLVYAPA